jgi:hypothetical protein
MPFGLSNTGSTFQRVANNIFQDLITEGVILVYLDDILVHTQPWQQHIEVLLQVLEWIHTHNLQLQFRKCKRGSTSLKFLGYIISAVGIQMDPAKITCIVEFPQPNLVKKLQNFLGLINFWLRFIPHLATITAPMCQLLIKKTPFQWNEAH